MIKSFLENANFEDTGFSYTMSLISRQAQDDDSLLPYGVPGRAVQRAEEICKNISDKTLSTNLKELERDSLIIRTEYPQIPPKVEYSLSDRGKSLMAVLDQLCVWGENNKPV